jgi:hypothetical protein
MTTWRVAAWTHPQDPGGFRQRTHSVEFLRFDCNDPEEPRGRMTMTVPADYPWQDLIAVANPNDPADTSLIRLYREGESNDSPPDVEYKLINFTRRITDDNQAVVDLFGADWRTEALQAAVLRWFDWAEGADRTVDPDWSFGMGRDMMSGAGGFETDSFPNGGFEDGDATHWSTPEGGSIAAVNDPVQADTGDFYGLWNPAGVGTILRRTITSVRVGEQFTVTGKLDDLSGSGERIRIGISGATTASHTNAYQSDGIWWAELANATNGNGSTTGSYQTTTLTFVAGEQPVELIIEYQDTGDHNIAVDSWDVTTGAEFDVGDWITGGTIATMNTAEISTEQAHSGTRSLKLQGSQPAYVDAFGRISYMHVRAQYEREITLTPGKLYTSEAWVYHTAGSARTFSIWANRSAPKGPLAKTVTGGFLPAPGSYHMASATVSAAPNTWTRLRWTSIADTTGVHLAVAWNGGKTNVGVQSSPTFYVDDYVIVEGLPASTLGVISDMIMDDAQTDHPTVAKMPYITGRTYTDTQGSEGADWPQEESVLLRRGQKYGTHIYGGLFRNLGYDFDVTPNTTDPTDPEWDLHLWGPDGRGTDRTGELAFLVGLGVAGGLVAGRLPAASRILAEGADGIITEVANGAQETQTGIYEEWLGDPDMIDHPSLTARAATALEEELANRIAVSIELDDSAPTPYADFGVADRALFGWQGTTDRHERKISEIAMRAEADANGSVHWTTAITASRLLQGEAANREALYRLLTAYKAMPEQDEDTTAAPGGGGGAFTFQIAAADGPPQEQADAHMTAHPDNAAAAIMEAANQLDNVTTPYRGGRIVLGSGTFNIDAGEISLPGGITLEGVGPEATLIQSTATSGVLIATDDACAVRNLSIKGGAGSSIGISLQDVCTVDNVWFFLLGTAIQAGSLNTITRCSIPFPGAQAVQQFVDASAGLFDIIIAHNQVCSDVDIGSSQNVLIMGNEFTEGIFADGAIQVSIIGNYNINSSGMGLIEAANMTDFIIADNNWLEPGGFDGMILDTCTRGVVRGNHFGESTDTGILLDGCTKVLVEGNYLEFPGLHGIQLVGSNNCSIVGNFVFAASQNSDNTSDNIYVAGDANLIHGNKLTAAGAFAAARYGINIVSGTGNAVHANDLGTSADYGTADSVDNGTSTITTAAGGAIGGQFAR